MWVVSKLETTPSLLKTNNKSFSIQKQYSLHLLGTNKFELNVQKLRYSMMDALYSEEPYCTVTQVVFFIQIIAAPVGKLAR